MLKALYEAGYITYMRTDRPSLSKEAAAVTEQAVRDSFGGEYIRKGERVQCNAMQNDAAVSGGCFRFVRPAQSLS